MLTLKSLQLYVCSVNPQLQEELLVRVAARPLLAHMVFSFLSFLFHFSLFYDSVFFLPSSFSSVFLISSAISFYMLSDLCFVYTLYGGEARRGEGVHATVHMWRSEEIFHSPSTVWVLAVRVNILRDCSYGIKSSRTGSGFYF